MVEGKPGRKPGQKRIFAEADDFRAGYLAFVEASGGPAMREKLRELWRRRLIGDADYHRLRRYCHVHRAELLAKAAGPRVTYIIAVPVPGGADRE